MSSFNVSEIAFLVTSLRFYLQLGGHKYSYIKITLPPPATILIYHMDYLIWVPMELLSQPKYWKFTWLKVYMSLKETIGETYGANICTSDSGSLSHKSCETESAFWGTWLGKSVSRVQVNLEGKRCISRSDYNYAVSASLLWSRTIWPPVDHAVWESAVSLP